MHRVHDRALNNSVAVYQLCNVYRLMQVHTVSSVLNIFEHACINACAQAGTGDHTAAEHAVTQFRWA